MKRLVRRQFALFLCTGLGATAVHVAIAVYLIGSQMMPAAAGNAIAFVFANLFSYFFQSLYVFERRPALARYGRFVTVSLLGLGLAAFVANGLEVLAVHYLTGIAVVVLIVPIATFCLHSLWTFRDGGERQTCR